jgi:hypothetical protein
VIEQQQFAANQSVGELSSKLKTGLEIDKKKVISSILKKKPTMEKLGFQK